MNKFSMALAATALVAMAPSVTAAVTHNTAPTAGWLMGNGNNYSPANTTVLTTGSGGEVYLRWHQRAVAAPASVDGTYSFALGTTPLNFDWGFNDFDLSADRLYTGTITVKNVGTGQVVSYDPFAAGNDNYVNFANSSGAQNSTQLGFGFIFGAGWNPNVDATYTVTFDIAGLPGGRQSLTTTAIVGNGGVPEPATWAMMMIGFGGMGAIVRRRKMTTSVRFA